MLGHGGGAYAKRLRLASRRRRPRRSRSRRIDLRAGRAIRPPHPHRRPFFFFGSTTIFTTPAFAQTAGAAAGGYDTIIQYLTLFGPIILIMYFMVLRPQQRAAKAKADLLKNIRRGDTITTSGGIIGKVTKVVDDNELEVEIAPNIRVRVARPMVSEVRSKGEPIKDV